MTDTSSQNYTIVEPTVELIPPPSSENYLEFLEQATRVCYKSEGLIKPGSAEKLMTKVVKEYEHLSVTEHMNIIVQLDSLKDLRSEMVNRFHYLNPLLRIDESFSGPIIVSGNIRMWIDLFNIGEEFYAEHREIQTALSKHFPFFFEKLNCLDDYNVKVLDSNPFTNKDKLTVEEMKQHMTLTFKFIGDRSMSHQLVRHRLFAFSQESQRYCNYGKKGFQIIIPPTMIDEELVLSFDNTTSLKKEFINGALVSYQNYLNLLAAKVPPEDARGLLPNCTKTEVVVTGTLGYFLDHVIPHRGHNPKAQWQIRQLFLDVGKIMKKELTLD